MLEMGGPRVFISLSRTPAYYDPLWLPPNPPLMSTQIIPGELLGGHAVLYGNQRNGASTYNAG